MPRTAKVYSIVIASPSDVIRERHLVAEIIDAWNSANSYERGVMLEAIRWETHTHPDLGERTQSIINSQIIDRSDVLIGIFGTQLGTDTGVAPSGTAEEIQRFMNAGKPAAVYFSDGPVAPKNLDYKKYQRLATFRKALDKEGLVRSFTDLPDLKDKISGDLSRIINRLLPAGRRTPRTQTGGSYDRQSAFAAALRSAQEKPLIRGSRYTRNDIITTDGDLRILETWEGLVSFTGEPLRELPTYFKSRAGLQAKWRCDSAVPNQSVGWLWDTGPDGDFAGRFVFDPPLTSVPTSFKTERFVRNGISFTKSERLQATGGCDADEELSGSWRNLWEECVFGIRFPEHRFPREFSPNVYGPDGRILEHEKAFFLKGFKSWPEMQTLTFSIRFPIPEVTYSVRWPLPDDSSSQLSLLETGFVDETARRLVGLRNGGALPPQFLDTLRAVRERFVSLFSRTANLPLSVSVYVYDRQKSGLSCVATLDAEEIERNWTCFFFKPGRGVAGRAFRRRDVEIYLAGSGEGESNAFEAIAGQEHQPGCIVCVPLFLGNKSDRVMAILSFETPDVTDDIRQFLSRTSSPSEIQKVCAGSYESLADALSTPPPSAFWAIEAHS